MLMHEHEASLGCCSYVASLQLCSNADVADVHGQLLVWQLLQHAIAELCASAEGHCVWLMYLNHIRGP